MHTGSSVDLIASAAVYMCLEAECLAVVHQQDTSLLYRRHMKLLFCPQSSLEGHPGKFTP